MKQLIMLIDLLKREKICKSYYIAVTFTKCEILIIKRNIHLFKKHKCVFQRN